MRAADLGITGFKPLTHDPKLTEVEAWALDSIRTWCQRGAPMPAPTLAAWLELDGRDTRRLVNHLIDRRFHGLPVYPVPGRAGGYFVPGHQALRERTAQAVAAQLARARTSAVKARDLGASVQELADGVVQLTLDLGLEVSHQVGRALAAPRGPSTHADAKRVLQRYARDPRAFAREIAELRRLFGGLFVAQEDVARIIRQHSEELIGRTLAELRGEAA